MPLLRYFFYVGGILLGLILISNFVLPQAPLPSTLTSATELPPVRIHSDRKLPERVVLDTSSTISIKPVPMLAPVSVAQSAAPAAAEPTPAAAAEIPPKARVREAFAQLPDEQASKSKATPVTATEPKVASKPVPKRKVAKPRPGPVMVAQQPFFGRPWIW
jgi:hypothetical protein